MTSPASPPRPPRQLNLNIGINTTGYLAQAWRWRSGRPSDIHDPAYYRRLTETAHRGRLDAVFFSDHPALRTTPADRPFHTLDPLVLAGGSEGGIDLAARHGEIIYCNILSRGAGRAFGDRVRTRAAEIGRDPAGIRIVPGLVFILADSRDEALRKHELWSGAGSEDGLLKRFVQEHGLDPATFDPDAVLDPERFVPDPSRLLALGMTQGLVDLLRDEKLTARQAVRRSEGHHRLVLGTAEDIADALIDLWQDGTVDGYTLQPPRAPDDITAFVDQVVPILQDRGVFRRQYAAETLRERYGLPWPH